MLTTNNDERAKKTPLQRCGAEFRDRPRPNPPVRKLFSSPVINPAASSDVPRIANATPFPGGIS
jgi:hypothetical protein